MIDTIIYVEDFPQLVGYLNAHYPELLARDDDGGLIAPPVVIGFARTPAVENGTEVMVYARLSDDEAQRWREMPGISILGEAEFRGAGTAADVYAQAIDGGDRQVIYDRVYPRVTRVQTDPEMGEVRTQPPLWFGVVAGA